MICTPVVQAKPCPDYTSSTNSLSQPFPLSASSRCTQPSPALALLALDRDAFPPQKDTGISATLARLFSMQ
eukprot:COSAG06_NODE_2784_length_6289_cov_6.795153_3_plen_71_part_00